MLPNLVHHGLKQTSSVAVLCGRRLPTPATFINCAHRPYGEKQQAEPKGEAQRSPSDSAASLHIPTDVEFQGFPSLEQTKPKQENRHRSGRDFWATEEPIRIKAKSGSAHDDANESTSTPLAQGHRSLNVSTDLSKQDTEKDSNSIPMVRRLSSTNSRSVQLMRPLLPPTRFYALKRERRRLAAKNVRGHVDLEARKEQGLWSRSQQSTQVLEAELRWVGKTNPAPRSMRNILEVLIGERKVNPSTAHYEALILGQAFPEFGSIDNVNTILGEIERESSSLEAPVLHAVLTVLSVHPDTHLRHNILGRIAAQQHALPDAYAHLNIIAMMREGQLEMATIELETLSQRHLGTSIPNWLWTIYIHAICDIRRDFDALLQLLYRLSDSGFSFPRPTLLYLLQQASKAGNIEVTKFIWHGYVEAMHVIPNFNLCMSVLRLAVRQKDVKLAESVAVVLQCVAGDNKSDPPLLKSAKSTSHSLGLQDHEDSPTQAWASTDTSTITATQQMSTFRTSISRSLQSGSQATVSPEMTAWTSDPDSDSESLSTRYPHLPSLALATEYSTPPRLPDPSNPTPPLQSLPPEALRLLAELGITEFGSVFDATEAPTSDHTSQDELDDGRQSQSQLRDPEQERKVMRGRKKAGAGILYHLFREETGLAAARFDPRLALMRDFKYPFK